MLSLTTETIFAQRYQLVKNIGIGGFSEVWLAKDQMAENSIIALKIYAPERGMDNVGIKLFQREYSLVLNLSHPNLLTARYFDVWNGSPYLVLSYCSKGSVYGKIAEGKGMNEQQIAQLLLQVCRGLAYLHKNNISHQDIKPENILINEQNEYLLTDFGISGRLRSTLRKSTVSQKAMTMAYAAPELFGHQITPTEKSDIFSIGVLICELATGEVPWMGAGGAILKPDSQLPELPKNFSPNLIQLMQQCMNYNPENRPSAQQIVDLISLYIKADDLQVENKETQPMFGKQTVQMPLSQPPLDKPIPKKQLSLISKKTIPVIIAFGIIIFFILIFVYFNNTRTSYVNELTENYNSKKISENTEPVNNSDELKIMHNVNNHSVLPGKYSIASSKLLKNSDLQNLSKWELKIMRNEIFARYGYVFKSPELIEYFNNQTWYRNISKLDINDDCSTKLTEIEKANIDLIKFFEK